MNRTLLAEEPRLRRLVASAMRRARESVRPVVISLCRPVEPLPPLTVFARARDQAPERLYWATPSAGMTLVGLGAAATLAATGRGRFAAIAREWARLTAQAMVRGADAWGTGPILMGGFSFAPRPAATGRWSGFPGAFMVLPRMLWTWRDERCWLTVHAVLRPEGDAVREAAALARCWTLGGAPFSVPEVRRDDAGMPRHEGAAPAPSLTTEEVAPAGWRQAVAAAAELVNRGELEKVVLARELRVTAAKPFAPARVLGRLADDPSCYAFAVARRDRCFVGATPERLVRLEDRRLEAMCLAGSRPRGSLPAEDEALARELLTSGKEHREHEVVVRALREALGALCQRLDVPGEPEVLRLRDVQHLLTPVVGWLDEERHVLELVARLHPTPAVAGFPRRRAMALLRRLEALDRGWYAGTVGWLDARGRGEFAVAIRSGLLHGAQASLYAGCGIVAGSDPEAEYAESHLKFRAMLTALEGT